MLGEGGAGSERQSQPAACPQPQDLPSLPHLGGGEPERPARRGLGRVIALGGLRRAGAEKGIKLPFLGPPGVAPSLGVVRPTLSPPPTRRQPGRARPLRRLRTLEGAGRRVPCRRAAPGQARKPGGARDPPARPGVWRAQGARGWGPSWAPEAEIAGIGRRWWKEIAHRKACSHGSLDIESRAPQARRRDRLQMHFLFPRRGWCWRRGGGPSGAAARAGPSSSLPWCVLFSCHRTRIHVPPPLAWCSLCFLKSACLQLAAPC